MIRFLKWFFEQHLKVENSELWLNIFKNFITLLIVGLFAFQVFTAQVIKEEFWLLLGMVLGFYFQEGPKK